MEARGSVRRQRAANKGVSGALNPAFVLATLGEKISQDDIVLNEAIRNAPVMQGLVLNTNDLVVGREGATLTVTVTAFDDACGISGVSGQYGGPGAGSGGFFPMQSAGDPNTFVGRIQFNPLAPRGTWRGTIR